MRHKRKNILARTDRRQSTFLWDQALIVSSRVLRELRAKHKLPLPQQHRVAAALVLIDEAMQSMEREGFRK